jgi:hypothetical protein
MRNANIPLVIADLFWKCHEGLVEPSEEELPDAWRVAQSVSRWGRIEKRLFIWAIIMTGIVMAGQAQTNPPLPRELIKQRRTMPILESLSRHDLLIKYPNRRHSLHNESAIKEFLSGANNDALRVSLGTETVAGLALQSRPSYFQVNFSRTQFLILHLMSNPRDDSLVSWRAADQRDTLRSDVFFEDSFYSLDLNGNMNIMYFGDLERFWDTCIQELKRPAAVPQGPRNLALDQAIIDFRKYATIQNLGHDAILPLSYRFDGDVFTCVTFAGERVTGRLFADTHGMVEKVTYDGTKSLRARTYLFLYDTVLPHCDWFPSRILFANERDGRYDVKMRHTIYAAYASTAETLSLPKSINELYYTNVMRTFIWTNAAAYQLKGNQLIEEPRLTVRQTNISYVTPRTAVVTRVVVASILIVSVLAFALLFKTRNK